MREWYASKTEEERRRMREQRDKARERRNDRYRYHNDPARREYVTKRAVAWGAENKKARRAQSATQRAVKTGQLVKPDTCSINDDTCYGRIEAHHTDYAKPLEVTWLCRSHHSRWHSEHGSVAAQLKEEPF